MNISDAKRIVKTIVSEIIENTSEIGDETQLIGERSF